MLYAASYEGNDKIAQVNRSLPKDQLLVMKCFNGILNFLEKFRGKHSVPVPSPKHT